MEQTATGKVEGAEVDKEAEETISNRSLSSPGHQKRTVAEIKELFSDRLTHSES